MTQTIEQLQARVAELEAEVEFQRKSHKQAEKLMLEQGGQLAAAQAEIERLRDAVAWAKSGFNQASMGIIIQRELEELFNLCRDALDQPSDTSALEAYVAEKVKEYKEDMEVMAALSQNNSEYVTELTRQRDLAVEALIGIENFAVQPWAGMATEALLAIKESEVK